MEAFITDLAEGWVNDAEIGPAHEKCKEPDKMCLFKEKLFHFFKHKMDGSKLYIGIPLNEVHWQLGITDAMFDKAMSQVLTCLRKQRPKPVVLRAMLKRISETRAMIVTPPDYMNEL